MFLACGMATGLWASSIPGALSGRFTINASGDKVQFSQGNLQYVGTWQFAENQWDCFSTSQYNDHRDLFGWGTGDAPNKVSKNNGDYGTFTDWGTNAITNGGNTENSGWRTLTKDEWVYLFYSRVNASTLFGFGSVAGVNGLIILPDNWTTPEGASFTASTTLGLTNQGSYYYNGNNDNYSHNTYTAEQWAVMESAGAVFLPAAAYRHGVDSNIQYTYQGGFYWSSTPYDSDKAYYLNFYYHSLDPQFKEMRYGGRPVRLVRSSLEQDAEGNYLLSSADDWKDFAAIVNNTNPTANARMTADIDLGNDQTKIGDSDVAYAYGGIFDGQGHTLNVNYYSTSSSTAAEGGYTIAPFRNIKGATIKNLTVTGSITGYRHPAGVVGYTVSPSTNLISNVTVSATINIVESYGGGFVGHCETSTTTIQDCLFNGTINGSAGGSVVGVFFANSNGAAMSLVNCFENGSYTNCSTLSPTSCPTGGTTTVTNCYYTVSGSYPGTHASATELADGTTACKLQNHRVDLVWGQRIGTDARPVLTSDESKRVYKSKNGGGTNDPALAYTGLEQDTENYYLLGSEWAWIDFAALVNGGTTNANARMTADIDLGNDQTMVGTISVPYQGEFDGQGHTLTVNYNMRNDITGVAPFACVGDATIQNLHVAGSVIQQYIGAGGIVAQIKGNLTMKRCWVSAYVNAASGTVAGIAGYCDYAGVYNKTILLEDCLFSGHIDQGYYSGGLMSHIHGSDGYNNSGQFINCLNVGTCNNPSGYTGTFARTGTQGDPYTITNCYYKIAWRVAQGTQASTAQLSDGTIAYRLQNNRGDMVWGQRIGTDAEPVLTNDENYRVYRSKTGGYTNNPEEAYEGIQQDGEGNYLLGCLSDWRDFAELVQTTPTANAKMTADIDLGDDQTKIGSFSGIFDGQGHTITINLSTTEQYVGLFCNITDATINNLHVTGAITTNTRFVGGMVGRVYGTSTIQNCWSSVDVTTTYGGDGVQGGMVGCVNGTLNISDCLYNGALNGSSAYTWGGFVGWLYGTTNISNCLFASDEINVGASYTATHVAGGGTVTNCYYKNVMGSAQGTQATEAELANGTTAYKLQNNRGDLVWGQRIGTDAMPVLTNDENYRVYRSKTGGYTNNPEEAYEGIQQDGEGNYLLGCLSDWQVFAEIVNSGTNAAANAKMTADIDLGDDQTHIGSVTEGATPYYAGIFDGQGHTLTVNYVGGSDQIVAPFTQISSATIKNLHVAGSIQSSYAYIGVVGMAGSGSVISKVWMSATMNTTQDGWVQSAAIAGYCNGSIQDCLFTGTYTSNGGGYMGGFHGYTNASPTITNCLSTGTFSQGNWQGNGVHTNCYFKQYPTSLTSGCSWTSDETLSNGTITTALQNNRAETVWVQDPLTNQPMLALFAGKYKVPASGLGTFSAKAAFTLPEGLEAYYCKNYDASAGTIAVIAIDGVVPAETGVLLKGTTGETYTLTISDETAATVTDNALVAVTEQMNIAQTADDYTNFGLSGGVFKKVNTNGGTVKANRAYLRIPTSALTTDASARGISLVWDEDPTGITVVNGSGFKVNDYYDLQGRRVENPTKGLYIVNGKKVIIK